MKFLLLSECASGRCSGSNSETRGTNQGEVAGPSDGNRQEGTNSGKKRGPVEMEMTQVVEFLRDKKATREARERKAVPDDEILGRGEMWALL